MRFYGIVKNGNLTLSVSQKLLRQNYLRNLKDDTHVTEEIKRVTTSKTHAQVKAIFGLALATVKAEFDSRGWDSSILLRLDKPTGIEVSTNFLKEYFYIVCPIFNDDGIRITLSHKDCDTKAASKFFEEVRAWSSSQWGIYIADPDVNWRENNVANNL